MAPVQLQVIAKSTPAPFGVVAVAHHIQDLPSASTSPAAPLNISYAHSLADGTNVLLDVDGTVTKGSDAALKALGDLYASSGLCGASANESAQINALTLTFPPLPPTFPTATAFLASLEQRLTLRTFVVGHSLTVGDFATFGALKANTIAQAQMPRFPHVTRWYNHVSKLPAAVKAVEEIAVQSKIKPVKVKEEKKPNDELKGNATFELGLPNAKMGEVCTRFPPEPSGYLHIGHAKAAILNQYFAKLYKGRFLVRFDDTNPSKEKAEFEESIIEDMALLGVKGEKISYTSDYFDQLHQYCIQVIKEGKAYADDTEQEKMRDERMNGIASARRESTPEESLARFAEMVSGTEEGNRWCIRAKISFTDPNKAMRDPVIYRTNALPHHRTGDKYKAYPTYDFACPIVDSLEGVTHALRTNEYRDRAPQYLWMLAAVGLPKIEIWEYGRMAFVYTLLSKRKLKWFVDEGHVRGWDDPRFATVRGIRRRGMTIEGLYQYMLLQGPSQAFTNLEWDVIWNINKKVIDPVAPRFVALEKKDLVKVTVHGPGTPAAPETKEMARHKKNPEVGTKNTVYSEVIYIEQEDAKSFAQDEEITLMDWGNAFVRKVTGSPIESIEMELNLTGDFKKTKKKVTWIGTSPEAPLIPVTLLDYDYLITKKRMEEDDDVEKLLTPVTEFKVDAVADHNVKTLKKGDIIQFERKGFYIVDSAYGEKESVELILIPDGKASSVALKAGAAAEKEKPAAAPKVSAKAKAKAAAAGATAPAAAAAAPAAGKLPEIAPSEPVETVLLSEGSKGFKQPVKTKMFKVDSIYGEVETPVKTEMFKIKPVYDI